MVAGPWPEAGVRFVIHPAVVDAVHAHSAWVETATDPAPPPASRVLCGDVSATWHLTGDGLVEVSDFEPHPAIASASRGASQREDPKEMGVERIGAIATQKLPKLA